MTVMRHQRNVIIGGGSGGGGGGGGGAPGARAPLQNYGLSLYYRRGLEGRARIWILPRVR